jgi:3-hydroxyisobutyrate dehydrogenase-like beta-hydroxyacid dehydrogenase
MRVGFVGLGSMGQGMARHLVKAGHEVRVWNRTAARVKPLVTAGATQAKTVAAACADAAVVFTMVADDAALIDVVSGGENEAGIAEALGEGDVHVSLSTISTDLSVRLAEAHAEAGQHFVAAPVFGRPEAAEAGKLTIVAAGDEAALARVQPLLQVMSHKVFLVGPDPQAANLVKLAGNFLIAAMTEALGEAFALLQKNGIDRRQFLEIVNGNVFRSPVYEQYGALIADGRHSPAGFRLALGLKDARLVLGVADASTVPMPLASLVRDHLVSAVARGKADLDFTALAQVVA